MCCALLRSCIWLLILYTSSSFGQKIAEQKCRSYQNPAVLSSLKRSIVGGVQSQTNEFPHMAALGYGPRHKLRWLCGGTLISDNYVLTAAHCTNDKEWGPARIVRLGTTVLKGRTGTIIEISKITRHPDYKSPSQYNDIALIKLKNNVIFSNSILPACLNTVFDIRPRTSKLIATGWGRLDFTGSTPESLHKVELNLYSHNQCKDKYREVSKRRLAMGILDSKQICAGGKNYEEKDTCQGDSGGPLVMKSGKLYTLVGITSFGKACGISNVPGVYTRVSAFVPWIEQNVW